jgi:hypothetical protein
MKFETIINGYFSYSLKSCLLNCTTYFTLTFLFICRLIKIINVFKFSIIYSKQLRDNTLSRNYFIAQSIYVIIEEESQIIAVLLYLQ